MHSDDIKLGRVFKVIGVENTSAFHWDFKNNLKESPAGLEITVDPRAVILYPDTPFYKMHEGGWSGDFIVTKGTVNFPPGAYIPFHGVYAVDVGAVDQAKLSNLLNNPAQSIRVKTERKVRLY